MPTINFTIEETAAAHAQSVASACGLPVWANLLLAVTEEVEGAMQGELNKREARIARYTDKYVRKAKK